MKAGDTIRRKDRPDTVVRITGISKTYEGYWNIAIIKCPEIEGKAKRGLVDMSDDRWESVDETK